MIRQNRICINLNKIQVIKKWKTPAGIKKLQFFLSFVNLNYKFL